MTADSRDRPGTLGNESPADVAEEQFRTRLRTPDANSPAGGGAALETVPADAPAPPRTGTEGGPEDAATPAAPDKGQPGPAPGDADMPPRRPAYRSESGFGQSLD